MAAFDDDRPIYLQIKEHIEGEILRGAITDGEQIPSTNELASFFGINPITVMKGVNMLADEEVIFKKRGIGMFVSEGSQERIQQRYREAFASEEVGVLVRHARSLQFSQGELQKLIDDAWAENEATAKDEGAFDNE